MTTVTNNPNEPADAGVLSGDGGVGVDATRHMQAVADAVPPAVERSGWTADRLAQLRQERLRTLLAHAIEHSPFHRERLGHVDAAGFTLDQLAELPVMTKAEMMRRFDDVVTDRTLTRSEVDAWVSTASPDMRYLRGSYVVMASGGSSGERGVFVYDVDAFTEFMTCMVRSTFARLAAFGVTPANPIPGALVSAGTSIHGSGAVGALLATDASPVRVTRLSATRPLGQIVAALEAAAPLFLTGYPSVLLQLAAEKAAGRLGISPMAVTANSEPLPTHARRSLEAAFGVPVSNSFGSSEGLCGTSMPGDEPIVFASDGCIVELVDDDLRPVSPGTVSAKVLVTNLYNLTQPLIRYELTDRFIEVPGPHPDGHLRAVVDGRHDEPFHYGDVVVHPLVIRSALLAFDEVFEYQVVQTPGGIDVRVVAPAGFDVAPLEASLSASLDAAGLARATVEVERVTALDRHPDTGKVRRFVPR